MEKLAIAIIKRSHGVKGYLRIKSLSGETDHFISLKRVFIKERDTEKRFTVEDIRAISPDGLLIKLKGINSPEASKHFVGKEILVERKYASQLKKGEYYISDLCKCNVYKNSKVIGHVKSVINAGNADLLEVLSESGEILMIPFIDHFVDKVDTGNGKICLTQDYEVP